MNTNRIDTVIELSATPMDYDAPNECRADWGEAGVIAADPDWRSNELRTSVGDALANIFHALERMGLDVEQMVDVGLCSWHADRTPEEIGGGKPAVHNPAKYPSPDAIPA